MEEMGGGNDVIILKFQNKQLYFKFKWLYIAKQISFLNIFYPY